MKNFITSANVLSNLDNTTLNRSNDIELNTISQSLNHIKSIFKDRPGFLKIECFKIQTVATYSFKLYGRYYVEDFVITDNFKKSTEKILKQIENIISADSTQQNQIARSDKRRFSKRKPINDLPVWSASIRNRIENGSNSHAAHVANQIKKNSSFLIDREITYRKLLASLNYSDELIETKVNTWYDVVIKDDSFMSEK